jgi:hypothetical protein
VIIESIRRWLAETWTGSEVRVDGLFVCFSLEDRVRDRVEEPGVKVHGQTAIPAKAYRIYRRFSPHFNRDMPGLVEEDFPIVDGKPLFRYVMVHWGANEAQTEGCPLIGFGINLATGTLSRCGDKDAFAMLWTKIEEAWARGEIVELHVVQETETIEWDRRVAA